MNQCILGAGQAAGKGTSGKKLLVQPQGNRMCQV